MKLDKHKIKGHLFSLIILCLLFLVGVGLSLNIFNCFTETVEIDAVVTYTYDTQHNVHTHNPGGPEMNIEWIDLNGDVQTEGNLANKDYLSEGDTYTILVDAKTHSRRMPAKTGSIMLFVIGVLCCTGSVKLIQFFYGRD